MKPNLILFVSDDHGYADSGVYGDDCVRTPNIDRLAKESMLFRNAFAASPLCVPSRCVMQTGLMPFRNGGHAFGTGIKEHVKTMPEYFAELGYHTAHIGKWHHGNAKQPPYDHTSKDEYDAADYLRSYDKSKPLLLVVCTHPPHLPWEKNTEYDPQKTILPPTFIDTPTTRECRADYYGAVTKMDSILGDVRTAMTENGYDENSFLMYTSDQGANWPFAKWCVYDAGLRVPFLVRWPGHVEAGTVTDAMIDLSDILPTCIDIAGGTPPPDIDGRSFASVLRDPKQEHRDVVFGAHTGYVGDDTSPHITNKSPMRTIRTRTHRYILNLDAGRTFVTHITGCPPTSRWYMPVWKSWLEQAETDEHAAERVHAYQHRPVEELYDITVDPHELNNLADRPEYAELCTSLRTQLDEWRVQQDDTVPFIKPQSND